VGSWEADWGWRGVEEVLGMLGADILVVVWSAVKGLWEDWNLGVLKGVVVFILALVKRRVVGRIKVSVLILRVLVVWNLCWENQGIVDVMW